MRSSIVALAALASLAVAPAAIAHPSASETIAMSVAVPTFPTYSATFTATGPITDSGPATVQALFSAVPSPTVSVLQSDWLLSGGAGSIDLSCHQIAKVFADPAAVPSTGSCTVIDATGGYMTLGGSGAVTGLADIASSPATLLDTVELGTL
jgi:hypothetical protein